ncbi:MAG: prepilin-type N-terminal cleavage/methylation domain-containing protein [Phycisphaeraceae bacterium]|nr:prepilin-type N-terminal cleavage/methylation domain-containing protein [Phycisphaeraceae bacterium]
MNTAHNIRTASRRAFTLIELVAVMVVLAILAGVAIPKYFDYADRAKTASCEGTLGGVRTGLASFLSDSAISGTAAYPTAVQLGTLGTVMQQAIPENPYNGISAVATITSGAAATARTVANTDTYGWNYYVDNAADPPVAVFWANSTTETTKTDTAGDPIPANEL